MYLTSGLLRFVPWLLMCGLIVLLERRFLPGVAASSYACIVVLATLTGALLLRSSAVGQPSWRNVVASMLLPCSGLLGDGSLQKLCVSNLLGSMLFGIGGLFVARYLRYNDYSLARIGGWTIACALAWLVLIGLVLFLVHQYGKGYYAGGSGFRKILAVVGRTCRGTGGEHGFVRCGLPSCRVRRSDRTQCNCVRPHGFYVADRHRCETLRPAGPLELNRRRTQRSATPLRQNGIQGNVEPRRLTLVKFYCSLSFRFFPTPGTEVICFIHDAT